MKMTNPENLHFVSIKKGKDFTGASLRYGNTKACSSFCKHIKNGWCYFYDEKLIEVNQDKELYHLRCLNCIDNEVFSTDVLVLPVINHYKEKSNE